MNASARRELIKARSIALKKKRKRRARTCKVCGDIGHDRRLHERKPVVRVTNDSELLDDGFQDLEL